MCIEVCDIHSFNTDVICLRKSNTYLLSEFGASKCNDSLPEVTHSCEAIDIF